MNLDRLFYPGSIAVVGASNNLGGGKMHSEKVHIPGLDDERYLIIVEKLRNTPAQYPRRIGLPAKKPL